MHKKNFAGIDYFRFIAAFMVIAIHIAPLSCWDEEADFILTYCIGRIAVPFFLMTTGYFVLAPYVLSGFENKSRLHKYLVKNIGLYLAATLFYLPLMLYSGNLPGNMREFLKDLLFDGTFYHLWYFPAAIIGCNLLMLLTEHSIKTAVIFSLAAYVVGLFGDSYYGIIRDIPMLSGIYDEIFHISSYTRNGIFFTPVFILLGMIIAMPEFQCSKKICPLGMILSLILLLMEGFITYRMDLQKHNSMYLFLLPAMYFLFQLLLMAPGKSPRLLRNSSMFLYVLHPAVIVLLRGIAKAAKLTELLIDNTLIQYLCVCILTLSIVIMIHMITERSAAYVSKRKSLD